MRWWDLRSASRGSFTLIGLLAAIVIIGILFVVLYGRGGGPTGAGGGGAATTLGGAKDRAQDVLCQSNINQVRVALSIYQGNSGHYPPSLEDLQGGVALSCPVGGEPYQYDPTTGQVRCTHPGHGDY